MNIREELKEALDFYFRRRPPLAALMWHPENKAVGETFEVPKGKIYEVYVLVPSMYDVLLNGEYMANNILSVSVWMPHTYGYNLLDGNPSYCMSPKGWILSEDCEISMTAVAFKVLWRDVTDVAPF